MQVWKDALVQKQESPYMRHTLASGTIRDFHFCPYEVTVPSPSILTLIHVQAPPSIPASESFQSSTSISNRSGTILLRGSDACLRWASRCQSHMRM